jgi:hypothetical protein
MPKLLAALLLALAVSTPAAAQRVDASSAAWFAAAPAQPAPPPAPAAGLEAEARKNRGRNVFVGVVAGAALGAIAGTYLMASTDEWLAPPAHIVTVPLGALVGGVIGALR